MYELISLWMFIDYSRSQHNSRYLFMLSVLLVLLLTKNRPAVLLERMPQGCGNVRFKLIKLVVINLRRRLTPRHAGWLIVSCNLVVILTLITPLCYLGLLSVWTYCLVFWANRKSCSQSLTSQYRWASICLQISFFSGK